MAVLFRYCVPVLMDDKTTVQGGAKWQPHSPVKAKVQQFAAHLNMKTLINS